MPAKEILEAIEDLKRAGWRVVLAGGRAHAHARAYCPGGMSGCLPLTIYGTPKVPEHESAKIRKAIRRCSHSRKENGR